MAPLVLDFVKAAQTDTRSDKYLANGVSCFLKMCKNGKLLNADKARIKAVLPNIANRIVDVDQLSKCL